jgi:hypothetical protein
MAVDCLNFPRFPTVIRPVICSVRRDQNDPKWAQVVQVRVKTLGFHMTDALKREMPDIAGIMDSDPGVIHSEALLLLSLITGSKTIDAFIQKQGKFPCASPEYSLSF